MGNQILPEEIPILKNSGYLEGGVWTKALVVEKYPSVFTDGRIDTTKLLALPENDQIQLGKTLFQYHCNDCHAIDIGYSSVGNMTRGWTGDMIQEVVEHPEKAHFFMPPWAGTRAEAVLLTKYLLTIAPPHPAGMYYGSGR
jgi:mono/diheme cytochrome c family protein